MYIAQKYNQMGRSFCFSPFWKEFYYLLSFWATKRFWELLCCKFCVKTTTTTKANADANLHLHLLLLFEKRQMQMQICICICCCSSKNDNCKCKFASAFVVFWSATTNADAKLHLFFLISFGSASANARKTTISNNKEEEALRLLFETFV